MTIRRLSDPRARAVAVVRALPVVFICSLLHFCLQTRHGGIRGSCRSSQILLFAHPTSNCVTDDSILRLPRHPSNVAVNKVLDDAETALRERLDNTRSKKKPIRTIVNLLKEKFIGLENKVYANTYMNLGKIEVVGFDYDYTLVSYKPSMLELIYNIAKEKLVQEKLYPVEMNEDLKGYDPSFAVRGLAVDLETACVCKITFTLRVTTAYFGRQRIQEGSVFGATVKERRLRLRPLNDLFSTVEACLLADVVQWFNDRSIPFDPRQVVADVLGSIGQAHISGLMHTQVASDLERYVYRDDSMRLREMLERVRDSGKSMLLMSNSAFWYVDAGMKYIVGEDWRDLFDVVIASAQKPAFYTEKRPFREVSVRTGRIKFKPITELETGEVYCSGSISELLRLTGWGLNKETGIYDGSVILYFGDSLFADLVDARRSFGWSTGAIISEVSNETRVESTTRFRNARAALLLLQECAEVCQVEMGEIETNRQRPYTREDTNLLDELQELMEKWRHYQDGFVNSNFGSIFRTPRHFGSIPSLFALHLRRHVDIYMSRIENLRLYSTDHRFYPLAHRLFVAHDGAGSGLREALFSDTV